MTSQIIFDCNGDYVMEGTVNVGGALAAVPARAGLHSGHGVSVPHGQPASASVQERNATEAEVTEAKAAGAYGEQR